ncbi:ComEC/Rec2 family competence protein [Flavobacterium sp.]|uniref:ComEC/Rec2 family competence protein n=1 Tax=Flavobacterium sp. TaxID=239 RepID=UPI00263762C1|nr:ComEC/Rec2 family competence protein [Flavobacterium sp.]MDG2431490.1 ComEC/Rec2 family competence protein [Flavobacterium sp.]
MKVLQFPLAKITLAFILGIVSTYYWNPALTFLIVGLSLSLLLLSSFFISKVLTPNKSLFFSIAVCFAAYFLGGFSLFLNTDSNQKSNYLHFSTAFNNLHEITIVIREKLKSSKNNDRYIALIQNIDKESYTGKIVLNIAKDSLNTTLKTGSYIKVQEKLYKNSATTNPNQFDYGNYLDKKQLYAQVYTTSSGIQIGTKIKKDLWYYTDQLRSTIKTNLEKNNFNSKELNVAIALLMGQKQEVSPDVMQDYQYAGAIHILSVSGLHVGYLMLFLTFLLKPIPNTKKGAITKLVILILILTAFAILAGLSPSVLRSVVMFSFVAIGYHLRRTVNIYHTLLVSAFLILLFQPYFIFDVGFQLSYLALFFIVWLQPTIANAFKPKTKIIKNCWTILSVSFAAQLGTLPLSLYYFHQFPSLFFITNLIVAPLLTYIMILGIIVLFLAAFAIAHPLLIKPLEWGIYALNYSIHYVASFEQFLIKDIPFNYLLLITSYASIIALIMGLKKPTFQRIAVAFTFLIAFQSMLLYTKWQIQNEQEWIVLNSKKNSIILERQGDQAVVLTNDNFKKTEYSNTIIQSYLVANFSQLVTKKKLPNLLYFNSTKILMIDSSGIYNVKLKPDVVLLTHSPKINLDRLLSEMEPKVVVADNSNYLNLQKQWERTCAKRKIPFHATAEKGFYKLN